MPITRNVQDELNRAYPAAEHAKLGDLLAELISKMNIEQSSMMTSAGLVIKAGSSAIVKAGSAFAANVSNTIVRKAANTDMAALVGTLATAKSASWPFYINASGTLSTGAKTADVATHALAVDALPVTPSGLALIGWITVDNATGSNFVGGTTALDTGSLTVTYYNAIRNRTGAVVGDLNSRV